ncbi:DNA/RNA helicase domain-containing protein [Ligilactobacillus agilis]|uniref:DNA/RNA helicase domain-containing protein n=1 Tax=Ligilactobacillus agilis TaxID=1601 RepID=UPI0018690A28|nr:DNA/RNA helicase domain-containing protein [Ligilactobacillus agilis]
MKSAAYINSLPAFIQESKEDWLKNMINNFQQENDLPLDASQVRAWDDCGSHLLTELADLATSHPQMQIIFEYRLPYGSDRRPDVLLIDSNQVIILEFKQKKYFLPEDIDQAAAYARDLQEYHSESRGKKVTSIVVLTKNSAIPTKVLNGTLGCSIDQLAATIQDIIVPGGQPVDIDTWINSNYEPLPTIVQAAQLFMNQKPLPNIRRVNSTGIPQALERLKMLTNEAKNKKKHIMALVTGVPGAGKTFLGLKYVYDICAETDKVNSVYLSGNEPLIKVLSMKCNRKVRQS